MYSNLQNIVHIYLCSLITLQLTILQPIRTCFGSLKSQALSHFMFPLITTFSLLFTWLGSTHPQISALTPLLQRGPTLTPQFPHLPFYYVTAPCTFSSQHLPQCMITFISVPISIISIFSTKTEVPQVNEHVCFTHNYPQSLAHRRSSKYIC